LFPEHKRRRSIESSQICARPVAGITDQVTTPPSALVRTGRQRSRL
jgi:hypothetical protein